MLDHMVAVAPNECCGIIAGTPATPTEFYPVVNAHPSPAAYTMDPLDVYRAHTALVGRGWSVWGIFHSHPLGRAYPSSIDTGEAAWPEVYYLIGSLAGPRIRAYSFYGSDSRTAIVEHDIILEHPPVVWPGFPAS